MNDQTRAQLNEILDDLAGSLHIIVDRINRGAKLVLSDWLEVRRQDHPKQIGAGAIGTELANPTQGDEKKHLTVKELAAAWRVSERSIYEWKRKNGLKSLKMGRLLRFDWVEANQWAKRHRESIGKAQL